MNGWYDYETVSMPGGSVDEYGNVWDEYGNIIGYDPSANIMDSGAYPEIDLTSGIDWSQFASDSDTLTLPDETIITGLDTSTPWDFSSLFGTFWEGMYVEEQVGVTEAVMDPSVYDGDDFDPSYSAGAYSSPASDIAYYDSDSGEPYSFVSMALSNDGSCQKSPDAVLDVKMDDHRIRITKIIHTYYPSAVVRITSGYEKDSHVPGSAHSSRQAIDLTLGNMSGRAHGYWLSDTTIDSVDSDLAGQVVYALEREGYTVRNEYKKSLQVKGYTTGGHLHVEWGNATPTKKASAAKKTTTEKTTAATGKQPSYYDSAYNGALEVFNYVKNSGGTYKETLDKAQAAASDYALMLGASYSEAAAVSRQIRSAMPSSWETPSARPTGEQPVGQQIIEVPEWLKSYQKYVPFVIVVAAALIMGPSILSGVGSSIGQSFSHGGSSR